MLGYCCGKTLPIWDTDLQDDPLCAFYEAGSMGKILCLRLGSQSFKNKKASDFYLT